MSTLWQPKKNKTATTAYPPLSNLKVLIPFVLLLVFLAALLNAADRKARNSNTRNNDTHGLLSVVPLQDEAINNIVDIFNKRGLFNLVSNKDPAELERMLWSAPDNSPLRNAALLLAGAPKCLPNTTINGESVFEFIESEHLPFTSATLVPNPLGCLQNTNTCFILTVPICIAYLANSTARVDFGKWFLDNATPQQIADFLFEREGGHALEIWKRMLGPNVIEAKKIDEIPAYFNRYGFGTVDLKLPENFFDLSIHQHLGTATLPTDAKSHTMILIGVTEHNGKKFFLFQNSWAKKGFVSMDEEYLRSCEPKAIFYAGHLTTFPVHLQKYTFHCDTIVQV